MRMFAMQETKWLDFKNLTEALNYLNQVRTSELTKKVGKDTFRGHVEKDSTETYALEGEGACLVLTIYWERN